MPSLSSIGFHHCCLFNTPSPGQSVTGLLLVLMSHRPSKCGCNIVLLSEEINISSGSFNRKYHHRNHLAFCVILPTLTRLPSLRTHLQAKWQSSLLCSTSPQKSKPDQHTLHSPSMPMALPTAARAMPCFLRRPMSL